MTKFMNQSIAAVAALVIAIVSVNAVITVPPAEYLAVAAPVLA